MPELKEYINIRYAKEASCCGSLSCGGALDHAKIQPGEVYADLGSGRGNDVLKAARLVTKSGKAFGIDFTHEMIIVAESNREKLKIENAQFLESPMETIPLENSSVDVITSNCTINHSREKSKVYSEIHRLLKPNGRAIISDIIADSKLPEEVVNDSNAWAGCYGGAIPINEYYNAIAEGGFQTVEVLEESLPYEKGGVLVKSITIRLHKTEGESI